MSFWKNKKNIKKGNAYRKNNNYCHTCLLSIIKVHSKRAVLSASMTLEALFIFPLILFFSVILIHVVNLINFQNRVNEVMYDTARNLAKLEYAIPDSANTATALAMLWSDLGMDIAKNIGVSGGNIGLLATNSNFENEEVDFVINYAVNTPFDFLKIVDYSCTQRACVRKWIGNEDKGDGKGEFGDDDNLVYITETGTVYHLSRDCTHIRLSIKTVEKANVENMRNKSGGKYYACNVCGKSVKNGAYVFITETGTKYHGNKNCSGLKRAIYIVPLSTVADWAKCSRCG